MFAASVAALDIFIRSARERFANWDQLWGFDGEVLESEDFEEADSAGDEVDGAEFEDAGCADSIAETSSSARVEAGVFGGWLRGEV